MMENNGLNTMNQLPICLEENASSEFSIEKIRLFWTIQRSKTRPEEESSGAKSKSGFIISGWSCDQCGFLLGTIYSSRTRDHDPCHIGAYG